MIKETLMMFSFDAPIDAKTVELLGSWDGFTNAYPLHPDRRRGDERWTGCPQFLNVVFDGSELSLPRRGGLKQGGCYWYFFRLNECVETYDDSLPSRSDCPLLPGQPVNFIEIPEEAETCCMRSKDDSHVAETPEKSSQEEHRYTLDPSDRERVRFLPAHDTSSLQQSHQQSLPRRMSLPESLLELEQRRHGNVVGDGHTPDAVSRDDQPLQEHSRVDQWPVREATRDSPRIPTLAYASRHTQSIDLGSFGAMRWLKRAYKLHDRSMSGGGDGQCYSVTVPSEAWHDPCELLIASLGRYQAPIVV